MTWDENAEQEFVYWFHGDHTDYTLRSEWFYGDCSIGALKPGKVPCTNGYMRPLYKVGKRKNH